MSKYKITNQRNYSARETWASWTWPPSDSPDWENAQLFTEHGLMHMSRSTSNEPFGNYGWIRTIVGGRQRSVNIEPCPSRRGLVRMAKKLQRQWLAEATT